MPKLRIGSSIQDGIARSFLGYPVSVAVAAIVSCVGMLLAAGTASMTMVALLVFPTGVIMFFAVLPLFIMSRLLAWGLGLRSFLYDGAVGGLAGLGLGPPAAALLPGMATDGVPELAFSTTYGLALSKAGPFHLLGGLAGGLAYRLTVNLLRMKALPAALGG